MIANPEDRFSRDEAHLKSRKHTREPICVDPRSETCIHCPDSLPKKQSDVEDCMFGKVPLQVHATFKKINIPSSVT